MGQNTIQHVKINKFQYCTCKLKNNSIIVATGVDFVDKQQLLKENINIAIIKT